MDTNSGNPIGVSIPPTSTFKGYRWTGESIYTNHRSANLKMLTDIKVAKVVFENKVAVGVQTVDGRKCLWTHFVTPSHILDAKTNMRQ